MSARVALIDGFNDSDLVIAVAQIAATIQAARLAAGERFELTEVSSEACVDEAVRFVRLADRAVAVAEGGHERKQGNSVERAVQRAKRSHASRGQPG